MAINIADPLASDPSTAAGEDEGVVQQLAWSVTVTFKSGRTKVLTGVEFKPKPDDDGRMVIKGERPGRRPKVQDEVAEGEGARQQREHRRRGGDEASRVGGV